MRVISRKRLWEFVKSRKHDAVAAERASNVWYKLARGAAWDNFGALRQTFGSTDQVGNCVVFDVGNNRFRLIGRVNYRRGIIYVLRVLDHAEYDRVPWAESCGCHRPPPRKPARHAAPAAKEKPGRSGQKGRK